ncbi:MAG: hypothetical protein ACI8RD_001472 [Bacillariaceae sp.]|jgi:hypothetical protein
MQAVSIRKRQQKKQVGKINLLGRSITLANKIDFFCFLVKEWCVSNKELSRLNNKLQQQWMDPNHP